MLRSFPTSESILFLSAAVAATGMRCFLFPFLLQLQLLLTFIFLIAFLIPFPLPFPFLLDIGWNHMISHDIT